MIAIALRAALLALALTTRGAWAGCAVDVRPVAFGVVDLRRISFSNGQVGVLCDTPTQFAIGIAAGPGGGDRYLRGPANQFLLYRLYRDATYTIEWGDGLTNAPSVAGRSDGRTPTRLTIFGALPAQGGFSPGAYTDALSVTIIF